MLNIKAYNITTILCEGGDFMCYRYLFNGNVYEVEINNTDELDVFEVIDLFDGDNTPTYMTKIEIELAYNLVL